MDKQRALYLVQHYRAHSITEQELNELRQWMQEQEESPLIKEAIEEDLLINGHTEIIGAERLDIMFKAVMNADKHDRLHGVSGTGPRVIRIWKWIAAACIVLVTGYGLWVTLGRRVQDTGDKTQVAKTNDVPAPKETRAVITLANGSKVYLDSASNGTIAQENNVAVIKNNEGEIFYQGGANGEQRTANSPASYNTLSNPRGSKVISLTLSDGTKVWLNSESSLKYPIAFNSNTREVEITGEAYFEVRHNSKQPFKVHLPNGSIVEDIGTAFNVNAYTDESDIKTTLIEGSVKVTPMSPAGGGDLKNSPNYKRPGVDEVVLKPNQQAVLNQANPSITRIVVQTNVDIEEVLSWKNGTFSYTNADLETIMRQMARWYDVEVEYKDKITDHYTVDVPRTVPVSQLFKFIEMSGGVHFKIEGRKITVMK